MFGWGGPGGRVYQKAYLEFFTSSNNLDKIRQLVQRHPNLVFYAVNYNGDVVCSGPKGVTALTWGVFPNKEILQPTVFALDTYVVWSKEAFALWTDVWAYLYDDETESAALLYEVGRFNTNMAINPNPNPTPTYHQNFTALILMWP